MKFFATLLAITAATAATAAVISPPDITNVKKEVEVTGVDAYSGELVARGKASTIWRKFKTTIGVTSKAKQDLSSERQEASSSQNPEMSFEDRKAELQGNIDHVTAILNLFRKQMEILEEKEQNLQNGSGARSQRLEDLEDQWRQLSVIVEGFAAKAARAEAS